MHFTHLLVQLLLDIQHSGTKVIFSVRKHMHTHIFSDGKDNKFLIRSAKLNKTKGITNYPYQVFYLRMLILRRYKYTVKNGVMRACVTAGCMPFTSQRVHTTHVFFPHSCRRRITPKRKNITENKWCE